MNKPFVHKILTGKVKQLGDPHATNRMDRPWESGIFKTETDKQIWLGKTGLKGDEVIKGCEKGIATLLSDYPRKTAHACVCCLTVYAGEHD